jgi:hypothetical protein
MIEHTLHLPRNRRSNISVGYVEDRDRCPFCGAGNFIAGRTCRCGVTCPSLASYQRPRFKARRKTPPSKLLIYRPQFDGLAH